MTLIAVILGGLVAVFLLNRMVNWLWFRFVDLMLEYHKQKSP